MTNFEKWLEITDRLPSPDNYVKWSWRFIVGAALQRRVWYGSEDKPIYPNQYIILYGPPGTGKSIVLGDINHILRYWKAKDVRPNKDGRSQAEAVLIDKIHETNSTLADDSMVKARKNVDVPTPPAFPYAPDATTYEALVDSMSKAFRRINYLDFSKNGANGVPPKLAIYGHCSMYFCLDELCSLFKKKADSVINYLLGLHGCPKEYEYKTKTAGEDRVVNGCLSFIAGTTPDFMEEVQDDKLVGSGFAARCLFICATRNRKNVSSIPKLTEDQERLRVEILEHIKHLSQLHGEVKVDKETLDYVQWWWNDIEEHKNLRINKCSKLEGYYARKQLHMWKTVMANHFSESLSMTITTEEVKQAIKDLEDEEPTMHIGLVANPKNPLAKLSNKIYDFIVKYQKPTMVDFMTEFWDDLPQGKKSLEDCLEHLIALDKVKQNVEEDGTITYLVKG